MVKKYTITFHVVEHPLLDPVTKVYDQPVWIDEPQWPLSQTMGVPMRFLCQIALNPEIFGNIPTRMAYIFMSDPFDTPEEVRTDKDLPDLEMWSPDGGENAVILQPGGTYPFATLPLRTDPRLEDETQFAVERSLGEDPEVFESENTSNENLNECKIGGTPAFLQGPEYPSGGPWKLLAQLDSCLLPGGINFGDAGRGYAFISEDGMTGKFLWQCM